MAGGRVRRPRFVLAALLLFWLARGSSAQPVAPAPPLGDLLVPGGLARLFHAANLPPPPDRAHALPTLARRLYQETLVRDAEQHDRAARLRDYLDVLGQWSIRASRFDRGITLGGARGSAARAELEDLLALIGLELKETRGSFRVERHGDPDAPRRRTLLAAAGVDADAIEQRLNGGAIVDVALPGDTVPLPLAPTTWLHAIFGNRVPAEALFALIIGEEEALSLYCGLLPLDADTRRFVESEPRFLAWIHGHRAALFAAFGESLRVRAGRVATPGGARDAAIWESLVGAPTSDPVRFLRTLLERDGGRLAWFYDAVAHLPPDRQAAVTGAFTTNPAARVDWLRSVYSLFLAFLPSWNTAAAPLLRRPLDPALALQLVSLRPGGRVGGPPWRWLWERVLADGELPEPAPDAAALDRDGPASLPWILQQVFARPIVDHRALFDLVLFAGRLFDGTDEAAASDALVALRGYRRFPALMLVLERMGVREPALFAEAARAARLVSASSDPRTVVVGVVQFQGAIALIDRLREVRVIDPAEATRLVRTLFAARPASDGWYRGAIVNWLDAEVLPLLGGTAGTESAEARVMMALAGMPRVPGPPAAAVEWEGQRYRIDLARAPLARLLRVREKQGGPELDAILAAWRRAVGDKAGDGRSHDVPDLARDADRLETAGTSTLLGPPLPDAHPLLTLDRAAAEWLASLAYAVRIENLDAPVLLGTNPALTHDLRVLDGRAGHDLAGAWTLPVPGMSGERQAHLEGSLLGLALPLSRYAVVRVNSSAPPHPPTVHENDTMVLMESMAAFDSLAVTDEQRDLIAASVRDGKARIARLSERPDEWGSVADALSADGWERQLIPWMLAHEPERVLDQFSAHDFFVLARDGKTVPTDGWGTLAQPIDGSLFVRSPAPALRRVLTRGGSVGILLTQFCDLHFRVATFLSDFRLPASLGRALLALAVPEFLERARLSHHSDWAGLVVAARTITDERLREFVSTLTADGPLVPDGDPPVPTAPGHAWRGPS